MRILLLLVLSLGLGVLAPVDAQAWKVWMQVDCTSWGPVLCAEAIDGTLMGIPPGEILPLEIHLDTEGESGLQLLSVGVLIDASQPLAYDPATSDASDYILYSPHVSNETLASQDGEQQSQIKELTMDNMELRAGARYPEWITGASIFAAGMVLGAWLRHSSARRQPSRIRL